MLTRLVAPVIGAILPVLALAAIIEPIGLKKWQCLTPQGAVATDSAGAAIEDDSKVTARKRCSDHADANPGQNFVLEDAYLIYQPAQAAKEWVVAPYWRGDTRPVYELRSDGSRGDKIADSYPTELGRCESNLAVGENRQYLPHTAPNDLRGLTYCAYQVPAGPDPAPSEPPPTPVEPTPTSRTSATVPAERELIAFEPFTYSEPWLLGPIADQYRDARIEVLFTLPAPASSPTMLVGVGDLSPQAWADNAMALWLEGTAVAVRFGGQHGNRVIRSADGAVPVGVPTAVTLSWDTDGTGVALIVDGNVVALDPSLASLRGATPFAAYGAPGYATPAFSMALAVYNGQASFDRCAAHGGSIDGVALPPPADCFPSLPTLTGYGTDSTFGSEGASRCAVTTTADSGPGSLRACVTGAQAGTTITAEVGGTLFLESRLDVRQEHLTIDGLQAPSPGFTIDTSRSSGDGLTFLAFRDGTAAHDVLIQGFRIKGRYARDGSNVTEAHQAFGIDCENRTTPATLDMQRIVARRLTLIDIGDSGGDIWGECHGITFSENLFTWNRKSQTISAGNETQERSRISLFGNIYHNIPERSPQIRGRVRDLEFCSNLVDSWQWYGTRIRNIGSAVPQGLRLCNNAWLDGPPETALVFLDAPSSSCSGEGNSFPDGETDRCTGATVTGPSPSVPLEQWASRFGQAIGAPYPTQEEQQIIALMQTKLDARLSPQPPTLVPGEPLLLRWEAPTGKTDGTTIEDTSVVAYKVYYGRVSRAYSNSVEVGAGVTEFSLTGLDAGTYYVVVTASLDGKESSHSNERVFEVAPAE